MDEKKIIVNLKEIYTPQPKQAEMHQCIANELLFGGSAGPGKSHALRHEALDWCMRVPGLQVYLFRRTYTELEANHILPSVREFPKGLGKFKKQDKRWEFFNGSMLHFCHCQYETDVTLYQGAEIHLLVIDELTTFLESQYDFLRGRVRCALPNVPEEFKHKIPGILTASNPGGEGHAWAKRRFVDYCLIRDEEIDKYTATNQRMYVAKNEKGEVVKRYGLRQATPKEGGMLRAYIPALLSDNPILTDNDPGYRNRVDAMQEPLRTAWLTGDWDIHFGQIFDWSPLHHICKPLPVPDFVPLYMTFDYGFGAPFSIGWWWEDNDGRLYRFSEWYGWNGTPNKGIRFVDSEIAKGVIEREKVLGIQGRDILRVCDPTCFNKKPDYRGGGQGPSTYEEFLKHGLTLIPGDADRMLKVRQFHSRLFLPVDGKTAPMLQVYSKCEHFIRTIPLLQTDPRNVEDVETKSEDHCYDEAALVFMMRPVSGSAEGARREAEEKRKEAELNGLDNISRAASSSYREVLEEAQRDYEYGEFDDIFG